MLPSHNEGGGREVIFSWNPSWLKNGDRRHYEAMQGLITKPYQVKHGIDRVKVVPMRSFVQNYYAFMQAYWNAGSNVSITDTGAASRTVPGSVSASTMMSIAAAALSSTYGIVVGSNGTAVTREDTKLNTQIAHGTSSTTLSHGATTVGAVTNVSTNISQIEVSRTVTGNTGSTVSILEDGVYANINASNWKFCIERNINSFGAVAAAQNVTITKTFQITS